MRKLTTVKDLEAVVGTQPQAMMMKAIDSLDEGSMRILRHVTSRRVRVPRHQRHALVHDHRRCARVRPCDVTHACRLRDPSDRPPPLSALQCLSSSCFPGIGETLRLTGAVADR